MVPTCHVERYHKGGSFAGRRDKPDGIAVSRCREHGSRSNCIPSMVVETLEDLGLLRPENREAVDSSIERTRSLAPLWASSYRKRVFGNGHHILEGEVPSRSPIEPDHRSLHPGFEPHAIPGAVSRAGSFRSSARGLRSDEPIHSAAEPIGRRGAKDGCADNESKVCCQRWPSAFAQADHTRTG